jgi:acetyl-CoA synthetase
MDQPAKPKSELEGEVYYPAPEVAASAHIQEYETLYQRSLQDPQSFWAERAQELEWFEPWEKVLDDSNPPFFKWFIGGKTNIVHNALDRHLKTYRKNKLALIWEGEPSDARSYSYFALNREVCKFANVLRSMGVKKGDIVTIYLPRIPEQVIAMLACAKVGAAHSVVYGGFSVEALAERIQDAESRLLITADGGWLRGKIVPLKDIADEAIARQGTIENCIVVNRTGQDIYMETGRDYWYEDLMSLPVANTPYCHTEEMDAEDLLFILYTSGTTGRPKGVVHTHGGYMVYTYTTLKYVFDIKDEDRWWCAADPGWITGHSYIVYARCSMGRLYLCTKALPTTHIPTVGGVWWSSTALPSCTPRRLPSAA